MGIPNLEGLDPALVQKIRDDKAAFEASQPGKMTPEAYTREYQDRAAEALRLRRLGLNPADYADEVCITLPGTAGCIPRR